MKRFLNKVREIKIKLKSGFDFKYELDETPSPSLSNNELFIGYTGTSDYKGLFINKVINNVPQIFSLSYDDFSIDFLKDEKISIDYSLDLINNSITGTVPTIPDEDGVA